MPPQRLFRRRRRNSLARQQTISKDSFALRFNFKKRRNCCRRTWTLSSRGSLKPKTFMKTKLQYLREVFAILIMAGCGAALHARADVTVSIQNEINDFHEVPGVGVTNDVLADTQTNATFGVFDNLHFENTLSFGGTYAYYDLERNIVGGTNVYHTLHVSVSAINSPFVNTIHNPSANAYSLANVEINEDLMVDYVPDSDTDTPPTSVSFQASYLVQGQLINHDWNYGSQPGDVQITENPEFTANTEPLASINSASTIAVSANYLGKVVTTGLNSKFTLENALGGQAQWVNSMTVDTGNPNTYFNTSYTLPDGFDLQYLFQGFVNIVDQNNQPIRASKLIFYCVNSTNTAERIAFAGQPDLTIEEAVSLEVIPGTNSLVLQWPSYATNYELETSTNLAGGWCTNSLPSPVQSGPFLQVTVPTTNSAAFFRLLQTN
jgi:hypothetical protein